MQNALRPILFADDSPADVELVLTALRSLRLGNEIVVVPDGAEALDFLHRRGRFVGRKTPHPAVVLLDIKMPRVDGLQVLREMRATPSLSHLPAVIFTSSREERDVVASYALGTNAYLVKPVDFREFVTSVTNLGVFWAVLNESAPDASP